MFWTAVRRTLEIDAHYIEKISIEKIRRDTSDAGNEKVQHGDRLRREIEGLEKTALFVKEHLNRNVAEPVKIKPSYEISIHYVDGSIYKLGTSGDVIKKVGRTYRLENSIVDFLPASRSPDIGGN